jgi:CheY-like chemotaxis protein
MRWAIDRPGEYWIILQAVIESTPAEAATEALLLLQGPGAPDVLVTDVVLATGMNGSDLANAARTARPDQLERAVNAVCAMSGGRA